MKYHVYCRKLVVGLTKVTNRWRQINKYNKKLRKEYFYFCVSLPLVGRILKILFRQCGDGTAEGEQKHKETEVSG